MNAPFVTPSSAKKVTKTSYQNWQDKVFGILSINKNFQSEKKCWKFSKFFPKVQKKGNQLSDKEELDTYYLGEHKCPLCSLVFVVKEDLSKHIDIIHDKFRDLVNDLMSF